MKQWKLSDVAAREHDHTFAGDFPQAIVKVLLARGIETAEQFRFFCSPLTGFLTVRYAYAEWKWLSIDLCE